MSLGRYGDSLPFIGLNFTYFIVYLKPHKKTIEQFVIIRSWEIFFTKLLNLVILYYIGVSLIIIAK